MSSLYDFLMLPTLPNYLSCHIHRCFDGLHNAVWYHLTIFEYCKCTVLLYCFLMNRLQKYTCLCIDNRCVDKRCVDKRKQYAFYKMKMHSPHSQNKTDKAVI